MDDAPRRAPSGLQRFEGRSGSMGFGPVGSMGRAPPPCPCTAPCTRSMSSWRPKAFPRLPRQRGHRAERQCRRGRDSSELSARLSSEKSKSQLRSLFSRFKSKRERSVHHARDKLASPFRHLQPHGPVPQRRPAPIVHPQPPLLHRHPLALLLTRRVLRLRQPPKRPRDPTSTAPRPPPSRPRSRAPSRTQPARRGSRRRPGGTT